MKKTKLVIWILCSCWGLQAQSAYTGGSGDGYAHTALELSPTSLDGREVFPTIRLYPNPAFQEDVVFLEDIPVSEKPVRIEVLSLTSQLVDRITLQPGQTSVPLATGFWPSGTVIIRVALEEKMGVFRLQIIQRP